MGEITYNEPVYFPDYFLIFGILPIYHLWEDKIIGGQNIPGSSGLTLNLNIAANKKLKNNLRTESHTCSPNY